MDSSHTAIKESLLDHCSARLPAIYTISVTHIRLIMEFQSLRYSLHPYAQQWNFRHYDIGYTYTPNNGDFRLYDRPIMISLAASHELSIITP